MKITAVGSIAYDTIYTPFAKAKDMLGGSLTYFSLAASYFSEVNLVGIVGSDFLQKDLDIFHKHKIDTANLKVAAGKTFRWSGKYDFDLNKRTTLATELNVFADFNPVITRPNMDSKYLFLGNIDPDLQFKVLKKLKNPELIVMDTMNYWIERKPKELWRTLQYADILVINDSEARQLAKNPNIVQSAQVIQKVLGRKRPKPGVLIIKQGEYGCLMLNNHKWFSLPAYPLENVYDPTGAGDSFAGGFTGYLASQKKISEKNLKEALLYGTAMASFSVEKLGPYNLTNLTQSQIKNRVSQLRKITKI